MMPEKRQATLLKVLKHSLESCGRSGGTRMELYPPIKDIVADSSLEPEYSRIGVEGCLGEVTEEL